MLKVRFINFLKSYCPNKPPILLGFSGGPDSMALFHLLVEENYPFEAAHIDHGWREESREEAERIALLCRQQGVVFHYKRLNPPSTKKNLEELGRKERFIFFKETAALRNLEGVFLGHHADDQAETVLKRLFEGASLPKLRGLMPKTQVEGILVYRPFLKIKKKDIIEWLHDKAILYFTDPTNHDECFLRTRLRHTMIPALSERFGKEISANLCRLGESAAELNAFLEELASPYLEKIEWEKNEVVLDFNTLAPLSDFLGKWLIKEICSRLHISLSYPLLEAIVAHVQLGSLHKTFHAKGKKIIVHKKKLTIFHTSNSLSYSAIPH